MRSNAPDLARLSLVGAAILLLSLLAGCTREPPEVREVRRATQDYFHALQRQDLKQIADRSTCLVSARYLSGARILSIEGLRTVRAGAVDSLARAEALAQRTADSTWTRATDDAKVDSLSRVARTHSFRASVYRCAERAIQLSAPRAIVSSDSTLETRYVRARFRYAGPAIGTRATDRETIVRLLRAPGGKWIVFSVYSKEDDPAPEML